MDILSKEEWLELWGDSPYSRIEYVSAALTWVWRLHDSFPLWEAAFSAPHISQEDCHRLIKECLPRLEFYEKRKATLMRATYPFFSFFRQIVFDARGHLSYLADLLRELTPRNAGITGSHTEGRIQRARALLQSLDDPASEISQVCDFPRKLHQAWAQIDKEAQVRHNKAALEREAARAEEALFT